MRYLWLIFLLSTVYIKVYKAACINNDADSVCEALARKGDCWFNPAYTQCKCPKSCSAPSECNAIDNNDKYCDCTSVAAACGINPMIAFDCPTTCGYRTGPECPAPVLNNVDFSSPPPYKYGDVITMSCRAGTLKSGGFTGIRFCDFDGRWRISATEGGPPVCETPTCGVPKSIPNAIPSGTEGVAGTMITYSCRDKTVKIGGGNGTLACGGSNWIIFGDTAPLCRATENKFKRSTSVQTSGGTLDEKVTRSSIECALSCLNEYHCTGYTFNGGSCHRNMNGIYNTEVLTKYTKIQSV